MGIKEVTLESGHTLETITKIKAIMASWMPFEGKHKLVHDLLFSVDYRFDVAVIGLHATPAERERIKRDMRRVIGLLGESIDWYSEAILPFEWGLYGGFCVRRRTSE